MKISGFGLLAGGFLLASCGGGGGDDSSSTLSYTGSTAQATVTSANADELVLDAYQNGSIGAAVSALTEQPRGRAPRSLLLADAIGDALLRTDPTVTPLPLGAAQKTANGSEAGNCGGTMSYDVTYDDQKGNFDGTLSFSNYCEDEVTLNGSLSFGGTMNLGGSSATLGSFTITTDGLKATVCGDSFTTAGTMTVSNSASSTTVTMDMKIQDGGSGKVYWMNNYKMTLASAGGGSSDATVSGRFYHPDHGYVDLSTQGGNVQMQDGKYWPTSGSLVATGAGSGARLTAQGDSYLLEVDADGDGAYDDYSETRAWTSWNAGC